jgi:hypothetical protein
MVEISRTHNAVVEPRWNRNFGFLLVVATLVAVVFTDDSWAGRSGGRGGRSLGLSTRSAGAGASHRGGFRHHHRFFYGGAVFIGAPLWAYYTPPYYYGPDYSVPHYQPPTVYVERFDGTPTPQTPGEIFCPDSGAYYPTVQDCPGGWQRVIHTDGAAPD